MGDFCPELAQGTHARQTPVYYMTLADIVAQAKISDVVSATNWNLVLNKGIYRSFQSSFPATKIEQEAGSSMSSVWKKLNLPLFPSETREVLYLLIHNKLPTTERLFRVNLALDPYCDFCISTSGAEICDRFHFFCACQRVHEAWTQVKNILLPLVSLNPGSISDHDLLTLDFSCGEADIVSVWLVARYVEFTWKHFNSNGALYLKTDELFGYLKFKYKSDQEGARMKLGTIPQFV